MPLSRRDYPGFRTARLFVVLGPIILTAAVTAGLAIVAAAMGWHREQMLVIAGGSGAIGALPALYLAYALVRARVAAAQTLRGVEARMSDIVESAMDAIIAVDESQKILLFNAAAEKLFRWRREAIIGQPLEVVIPERYRGAHAQHVERFGRTAGTSRSMGAQTVLYGVRADGQEFPIEASISQHAESGRRVFTVILRDVTERVSSQQLLARSEARLRGILDSAMDAIITVDERQHIVLFNRAAEDVFGCPREQAVGAPLAWFIPERFRAGHEGHVRRFGEGATASRRMGTSRVVMGLRRNGEEFPIDASISHIVEDGHGFYTVILRDVTARVRAEEALRESREEIREMALTANSVREQEKSRIARELHDELGQALTALKIDVGVLRQKWPAAGDEIGAKLASMQSVIDSTVAATRRISADLRPLMLDDLGLAAAAEWLVDNFKARSGIPVTLDLAGDFELEDPWATAVFRVLQESLTNISRHAQATQVDIRLGRTGNDVRLVVKDNGRGFDASAPRRPNSFGIIGLRERATLLGGEVAIDSEPGRGTVITMTLHTTPEVALAR
jgi:PAS domain S-box-containing protein